MGGLEWDDMGVKVDGRHSHHLRFADDIVLITSSLSLDKTMFVRNGWVSDAQGLFNTTVPPSLNYAPETIFATMKFEDLPPPLDVTCPTRKLVDTLSESLARCCSSDILLSATGGRDRSQPFTEFGTLICCKCAAAYGKVEQLLSHTLKHHFGEEHLRLYEAVGVIHKDVQRMLDEGRSERSAFVGRMCSSVRTRLTRLGVGEKESVLWLSWWYPNSAKVIELDTNNNQELCVLTPLFSPLAPFMLGGVTVSTREPSNKRIFVKKLIEGSNVEHIPLYFSVRAVERRHVELLSYLAEKKRKRRFREMKRNLKLFYIDAPDLLEYPPRDSKVAKLLHQATGFPIGTSIIPARKIRLVVPIISRLDEISLDEISSISSSTESSTSTYHSHNKYALRHRGKRRYSGL
ncbi:hypothetical protein RB195_000261 [Necator americanus]|uniref:C2H2-type domain-containing protein n=1 Tax=Necator americanus TaxID=51031 RepID=A0ABR1D8T5_NECAM